MHPPTYFYFHSIVIVLENGEKQIMIMCKIIDIYNENDYRYRYNMHFYFFYYKE